MTNSISRPLRGDKIMKRISFWALSTLSAVILLFGYNTSTSRPLATSETISAQSRVFSASSTSNTGRGATTGSGGTGSDDTSSSSSGSSTSENADGTGSSKAMASKTFVGDVAQTRWGPVQVQITAADSSITDVSVLEYPTGNGKDQEINSYALPILTQETIDSQSVEIDMVSGATVTSDGYVQSLQSALDQAGL